MIRQIPKLAGAASLTCPFLLKDRGARGVGSAVDHRFLLQTWVLDPGLLLEGVFLDAGNSMNLQDLFQSGFHMGQRIRQQTGQIG